MIHGEISTLNPSLIGGMDAIPTLSGFISSPKIIELPMEYQETSNTSGGTTVYIGRERGN